MLNGLRGIKVVPVREGVFRLRLETYEGDQPTSVEIDLRSRELMTLFVVLRTAQADHRLEVPPTDLPRKEPGLRVVKNDPDA